MSQKKLDKGNGDVKTSAVGSSDLANPRILENISSFAQSSEKDLLRAKLFEIFSPLHIILKSKAIQSKYSLAQLLYNFTFRNKNIASTLSNIQSQLGRVLNNNEEINFSHTDIAELDFPIYQKLSKFIEDLWTFRTNNGFVAKIICLALEDSDFGLIDRSTISAKSSLQSSTMDTLLKSVGF
jgi:hypothetical protein